MQIMGKRNGHGKEICNKMILAKNFLRKNYFEAQVQVTKKYYMENYPECEIELNRNKRSVRIIVYEEGTPF